MFITKLIVGILAAVSLVRAHRTKASVVPGAFIVEYADGVDIDSHLSSVQHIASTRLKLDHKLFKGASLRFHDVENAHHHANHLASTPHVKRLWPVYLHNLPKYTVHWNAGVDATLREAQDRPTMRQAPADTFSPHVMTQVNLLRDAGVLGEGIKIAVIDTGVDYKHPGLGGCFGPGCLVSFGYDFVGDHFGGDNTPIPDSDPMDCEGHGTHVAGIIAAQADNSMGVIGAASGVTLGAYRVFGCSEQTSTDVLIAAFNKAFEDGADIITASLGEPGAWSETPWSVVVSRIVEAGVPCTIAAGNDGEAGLFSPAEGASGLRATAIGSFVNTFTPEVRINATYTVQGGPNLSFNYAPGNPAYWANVTLPMRAVSLNTTDPVSACSLLSTNSTESSSDLSGYIVLIRRGTCSFEERLLWLAKRGASHVLFYNNETTGTVIASSPHVSGMKAVGMVTADQGEAWLASLSVGQNVTVAMADPKTASMFSVSIPNNINGGFPSCSTSWGPTYEVGFKPQLAAPGDFILSTFPTKLGSYAVMDGTSMSTPLVAAIYALLMTVRGTKDPQTLESLLSSTSKPSLFNDGKTTRPYLAPAVQQGSGLIQAYDAAYITSLLSVSSLSFNDTDNISVQTFIITNKGSESVVYTLGHVGAATGYTMESESSIYTDPFPVELYGDYATLEFSDDGSFTVPAGHRKMVNVTATPPAGLDPERLPVYSGYIAINGSDGSKLSLPYVGVVGSLHSATVLSAQGSYLYSSRVGREIANHTFILPPPHTYSSSNNTDVDALKLHVDFDFGSPLVRVDVVPVSTSLGDNITMTDSLGLKTLGNVFMTPKAYVDSNGLLEDVEWNGALFNGNYDYAPAGTYKFVVRALKIFGDRNKADQYETYETPEFSINYSS